MSQSKDPSVLVKAVLALDEYFSELDRLGGKITSLEMKSEFDFEHAEKLLKRFAECGEGVANEVQSLSAQLNEARARAEEVAKAVAERAEQVMARKAERQKAMDEFRQLGEQVQILSTAMGQLRRPQGETFTAEERAKISMSLTEFEAQLAPLIERAGNLRKEAQKSRMKFLEQNADSLTQTLQAIQQKLGSLNLPNHLPQ